MKVVLMRFLLRLFWIIPIKHNAVVLTAYNGRQFGCSPKYLANAFSAMKDVKVYYALGKNTTVSLPDKIIRINYRSLKHFYLLMTSRIIVFNSTGFSGLLPYRKSQIVINTWHGAGSFKTTGVKAFTSKSSVFNRRISGENTTFFLSSSKQFTEDQTGSMLVDRHKFLSSGLPRNDILFGDHPEIVKKVRDYLRIDRSDKIVLYAPTYRDGPLKNLESYGFAPIDVEGVLDSLQQRFGGNFKFVFKAHHDMLPENRNGSIINASNYEDTQELLLATDVLITDYSSIQWDYALKRKPAFLYTPDIENYMAVHSFASDYHSWPFEAARTNYELEELIRQYDEEAGKRRIEEYFDMMGSYENGTATSQVVKKCFG